MDKYYKQYLDNHSAPKVKLMHFIGHLFTLGFIVYCLLNKYYGWIILFPIVIYPFAVSGHYLFGKKGNRPSFHKMGFIRAKICDFIMFIEILKGKHRIW